jgi:hypothetical protein
VKFKEDGERARRRQYWGKKLRNILSGLLYSVNTDLFRNKIDISRIIPKIETLTYVNVGVTLARGRTVMIVVAWNPLTSVMFTD